MPRNDRTRWLRLQPRSIADAVELGYHAGRLGRRVRFDGEVLLVALEGRLEDYTAGIESLISARRVAVSVLDDDAADAVEGVEPMMSTRRHSGRRNH